MTSWAHFFRGYVFIYKGVDQTQGQQRRHGRPSNTVIRSLLSSVARLFHE